MNAVFNYKDRSVPQHILFKSGINEQWPLLYGGRNCTTCAIRSGSQQMKNQQDTNCLFNYLEKTQYIRLDKTKKMSIRQNKINK